MKRFVVGLSLGLVMMAAQAAPMTNADVIKLIDAGMPDSVIVQSIGTSATKFDVSSDALIKLKSKGASAAVLQAMINAKGGHAAGTAAPDTAGMSATHTAAHSGTLNPEEATVVTGGVESTMQYIVPQLRTAARAFGLGGVASYATLQGATAARKLPGDGVEFIISIPKNAQPVSYVTLANFAVRDNGTREVMVGGGYMSYSSGINKDRVIPIKSEPLPDQSRARDGFVLYKVTPEHTLAHGEYALVLYTREVHVAGYFSAAANSYFDFSVD
ncbi:MAG TPA: hypothetical protein VF798_05930 [Burkholderiaceae bacterium]